MKRGEFLIIAGILLFLSFFSYFQLTGHIMDIPPNENQMRDSSKNHVIGPSAEEQKCMKDCVSIGCVSEDIECMKANGDKCMAQCNVVKPEAKDKETSCMEKCVAEGCNEFDFNCQNTNKDKCEKECGMIKEPEAKTKEEQCIRDCVAEVDSSIICGRSKDGETGGRVCKKCADKCVYLYEGPCLDDKKLKEKQKACEVCKHCYGEPVMGDSGEGWECIIDVKCMDASAEFGDNPGEGPSITEKIGETFSETTNSIANFFKDLFTKDEKTSPDNSANENNKETNSEEISN
jgi:hypothetical protein